ncbi:transcription termination/antitermination protein NusA [Candidatus Uhrbacteria bacterium CG10_big_fil_rev_8_21_14_0_10_48_16]|uniref:Transcription termination/antitermination protein NusA n=1 Tax=Candidatus Uhrbacteria bacterium CG10_big_fil_rev_8_21_14_0_10_48_16 TaxID=1975038 RepID=A0A2M8LHF9_9BACT|nr:MAG: transcription termination/antitermination protein NusA [Candidatus Uhrbacteria bacterium CG10_big_fil_rev_8_21_14_0_10_48_16]
MSSPIEQAIRQICEEKGLAYESVIDAIQSALAAAYRKDFGDKNSNIEVEFDPATAESRIFDVKTVVEDIDLEELEKLEGERRERAEAFARQIEEARKNGERIPAISVEDEMGQRYNPKTDIMVSEAQVLKMGSKLGDVIRTEMPTPGGFGRMAAMTAKQVITQKLREAEREIIFSEFKEHEGTIMNGTVQRREGRIVLVDLGRTTAVMRSEDQIPTERYNPGDRIKVFVRQVGLTTKGPEILVSRTAEEMVQTLFEFEIPEIGEGLVQIKGIAREAGSRSKVAVSTSDQNIDPIGACIGQRGTRIQTIIAELGGEKIDIIEWSEDPSVFISNALSPAKITSLVLQEEEKSAFVKVKEDQLSLAIGKGGQNVRLAAKITGWKINISGDEEAKEETETISSEEPAVAPTEEGGAETVAEPQTEEAIQETEN